MLQKTVFNKNLIWTNTIDVFHPRTIPRQHCLPLEFCYKLFEIFQRFLYDIGIHNSFNWNRINFFFISQKKSIETINYCSIFIHLYFYNKLSNFNSFEENLIIQIELFLFKLKIKEFNLDKHHRRLSSSNDFSSALFTSWILL